MNGMYKFQPVCVPRNAAVATFTGGGALCREPPADPPQRPTSLAVRATQPAGESECRPKRAAEEGQDVLTPQHSSRAKAYLSPGDVRTGTHSKMHTHRAGFTHTLRCTHSLCAHTQEHCRGTHSGMHTPTSCSSQTHRVVTHTVACTHTPDACTHVHSPAYTYCNGVHTNTAGLHTPQWGTDVYSIVCTHRPPHTLGGRVQMNSLILLSRQAEGRGP